MEHIEDMLANLAAGANSTDNVRLSVDDVRILKLEGSQDSGRSLGPSHPRLYSVELKLRYYKKLRQHRYPVISPWLPPSKGPFFLLHIRKVK